VGSVPVDVRIGCACVVAADSGTGAPFRTARIALLISFALA
jgi:hypothetical protein